MIYLLQVDTSDPVLREVAVPGKPERTQSTYGILAMLSEGPRSGYEIKKVLSEGEMFYWKESYGNIYPILRRLTDDRLVRQIDADHKKKRRIYYELTDEGRQVFKDWLRIPPQLSRFRVELLMKLRFGEMAGIDNMISHIEHYRKVNIEEIDECDAILEGLEKEADDTIRDVRALTVKYLRCFKEAILGWCDESLELLAERAGEGEA
jgi:DNA-binding PadR family transcriptional regulator